MNFMNNALKEFLTAELEKQRYNTFGPLPDIAICSQCGWRGPTSECETGEEGDWETGYYKIHLCPKCADGGCVDDYDMSPERLREWEEWNEKQNLKM